METFPLSDIRTGIDFYQEVERFEVELITRALAETGGQQRRAARLLGLKATTLNAKIKQYDIECARRRRNSARAEATPEPPAQTAAATAESALGL